MNIIVSHSRSISRRERLTTIHAPLLLLPCPVSDRTARHCEQKGGPRQRRPRSTKSARHAILLCSIPKECQRLDRGCARNERHPWKASTIDTTPQGSQIPGLPDHGHRIRRKPVSPSSRFHLPRFLFGKGTPHEKAVEDYSTPRPQADVHRVQQVSRIRNCLTILRLRFSCDIFIKGHALQSLLRCRQWH